MASFNKVILIGRLTRDPELRYTPSGVPVAHFTLAVNRNRSSAKGKQEEVDFIDIVAWQKLAEICQQYLTKGRLVAIDGRLQIRNYEAQDGQKRKAIEVVANDMQILDKPASSMTGAKPEEVAVKAAVSVGEGMPAEAGLEDDVPF